MDYKMVPFSSSAGVPCKEINFENVCPPIPSLRLSVHISHVPLTPIAISPHQAETLQLGVSTNL